MIYIIIALIIHCFLAGVYYEQEYHELKTKNVLFIIALIASGIPIVITYWIIKKIKPYRR